MRSSSYLLAAFASATAFCAEVSYAPPVGGVSYTINAGTVTAPVTTSFTIPLLESVSANGTVIGRIGSLSATTMTVTGANWIAGALSTASAPYAIRVTSGAAAGYTFAITGNTADTLTVAGGNPVQLGVGAGSAGDSFRLLQVQTLKNILIGNPILGGTSAANADIVVVSSSTQLSFYFNTTVNRWVRTTGPTTDRGDTPIPVDGVIGITRKSGAFTLRFMGSVPTGRFCQVVTNSGSTYTHTGFPADVTLGALSLQTALSGWTSATNATNADTLSVVTVAGLVSYFFNGTNWQRTTGPATNRDSITIPTGTPIQIFKRGSASGSAFFLRNPPYSFQL